MNDLFFFILLSLSTDIIYTVMAEKKMQVLLYFKRGLDLGPIFQVEQDLSVSST